MPWWTKMTYRKIPSSFESSASQTGSSRWKTVPISLWLHICHWPRCKYKNHTALHVKMNTCVQYSNVTSPLLKCITLQKDGRNPSKRPEIHYFCLTENCRLSSLKSCRAAVWGSAVRTFNNIFAFPITLLWDFFFPPGNTSMLAVKHTGSTPR